MDEATQRLGAWLLKRSSSGERRLRAATLIQAAVDALGFDLIEARAAFRQLRAAGQLDYAPDMAGLPFAGYAVVSAQAPIQSASAMAWRRLLDDGMLDEALRDALLSVHELLADLEDEDRVLVVKALARIREAPDHNCAFGFSLSARRVLGSSKILDRLPAGARRLLGLSDLPATPRYVVVAGPPAPEAVVLIENTTTYEEAVRAGAAERVALVAAYGYGLNLMSESAAGWALVESLVHARCELLTRSGSPQALPALLRHPRLYFWGDLDREGLRIALALRAKLPQLELSALYGPMSALVQRRETSHPYVSACGKANQQPWQDTGDVLLDWLARVCACRAVDQEAIEVGEYLCLMTRGMARA